MKACPELDPMLPLRAAGALAPDEAARMEAHLAACPACRAEAEADAAVLELVRLPAVSASEREVMRELPARTVGAYRALERGRVRGRRVLAVTFAAAAAALLAVAGPALLRGGGTGPAASGSAPMEIMNRTVESQEPLASVRPVSSVRPERSRRAAAPAQAASPTWRSPDIDDLWDDTDALAVGSATASDSGADDELVLTDAALAAWDDAGL